MKEKINLSGNHRRVLSSRMQVIERRIKDMERLLKNKTDMVSFKYIDDIEQGVTDTKLIVLCQLKEMLVEIFQKYQLEPGLISKRNSLNASKATIWEILCDSGSKGLRGYGEVPLEYSSCLDNDVERLQKLIAEL
jgi:hypothetical protein